MSLPSYSDLKLWVGTLVSRTDWDYNFKKIVDWFSDGSTDLVVSSIKSANGIDLDGGHISNLAPAQTGSQAVNLDQAQTLLNRSSYYYLFSVASGKEDANGDSAFLQKDSDVQVTVLAGGVNPDLVICQSDGTVESLTSNTVLTVASADDTYYIVKEKGQAVTITSGKVEIGKVLPTSDISAGDYYLDNSTVPFKGYKYDSVSGWVETSFCLLGTVEKVSGTATCTSVKYNDNKFDLNVYNGNFMPDYSAGISQLVDTTHIAEVNGYLKYYSQASTAGNVNSKLIINDNTITSSKADIYIPNGGGNFWQDIGVIPVSAGDTYKLVGGSSLIFYPCKGV